MSKTFIEYVLEDLKTKEPEEIPSFVLAAVHTAFVIGLELPDHARVLLDEIEAGLAKRAGKSPEQVHAEIQEMVDAMKQQTEFLGVGRTH